jgi:uncharacterized membrane protein
MSARAALHARIARIGHGHRRLWISAILGIVAYAVLTVLFDWHLVTRLLAAWDIALLHYLAAAARMMARSPAAEIRRHAAAQDEGAVALLILSVAAAVASLGAIFVHLARVDSNTPGYGIYALHAVVTVVLSWAFIHTIFALHYAYEFYGEGRRANGLKFPDDHRPDYFDFVYFSFVIGMTFQVSDVAVTNKWIRRTVACHGALAFFFTTAIIALTVNIAGALFAR